MPRASLTIALNWRILAGETPTVDAGVGVGAIGMITFVAGNRVPGCSTVTIFLGVGAASSGTALLATLKLPDSACDWTSASRAAASD